MKVISTLVLAFFMVACSTSKKIAETETPVSISERPLYEILPLEESGIQGLLIKSETQLGESDLLQIQNANYNTLFLSDFKDVEIVNRSHKNEFNVFIVVNKETDLFFDAALNNDVNGILFTGFEPDASKLVELMTYKPHLVFLQLKSNEIKTKNGNGLIDRFIDVPFAYSPELKLEEQSSIKFPSPLKKTGPDQVAGLKFEDFIASDAIINGQKVQIPNSKWVFFKTSEDSIQVNIDGKSFNLNTKEWMIPYKYVISTDGSVRRDKNWLEIRRYPKAKTDLKEFHLLAKSDPSAKATINQNAVHVYKTGIFFSTLTLEEGSNLIRADVKFRDGTSSFYEMKVEGIGEKPKRKAIPLWIDTNSFNLAESITLSPQDELYIEFKGSKGQKAQISLSSTDSWFVCSRSDHDDYSLYSAVVPFDQVKTLGTYGLQIKMNEDSIYSPDTSITIQNTSEFPIVKTTKDHVRMTYNLGPVRLGGPIRSELKKGTVLKTNGIIGDFYRIQLNHNEHGLISKNELEILPNQNKATLYFITNILTTVNETHDIVSIPYLASIPYEIVPEPHQKRIVIRLFGAKTSATWISHRAHLKYVDHVTWKQTDPTTFEVHIHLKTDKLWGYELSKNKNSLQLSIKHAPQHIRAVEMPLNGLKIAIEAGHGGSSTGANGLSGILEKDINLALALTLGELLENKGAEILQVRPDDRDISLLDKRTKAEESGADLFVSIHANSAGGHYLRVSGTSTYYNNPFWEPFAEKVYLRLLETGLPEFGIVGSFNYTPIRTSKLPSILVEQAFLSHAEDEEKMADPKFRLNMAKKIVKGIEDYVRSMFIE